MSSGTSSLNQLRIVYFCELWDFNIQKVLKAAANTRVRIDEENKSFEENNIFLGFKPRININVIWFHFPKMLVTQNLASFPSRRAEQKPQSIMKLSEFMIYFDDRSSKSSQSLNLIWINALEDGKWKSFCDFERVFSLLPAASHRGLIFKSFNWFYS